MTLLMRHGEWEESREREDVRRGDVALPSNCKANFKRSFEASHRTKCESVGMKGNNASKHSTSGKMEST